MKLLLTELGKMKMLISFFPNSICSFFIPFFDKGNLILPPFTGRHLQLTSRGTLHKNHDVRQCQGIFNAAQPSERQ